MKKSHRIVKSELINRFNELGLALLVLSVVAVELAYDRKFIGSNGCVSVVVFVLGPFGVVENFDFGAD